MKQRRKEREKKADGGKEEGKSKWDKEKKLRKFEMI